MTTTARRSNRPSTRRVAGALGSALAVAVVGVGVLPAGTAEAAGVRTTSVSLMPAPAYRPLADPAATSVVTSPVAVTYRVTSRGLVATGT